MRIQGRWIVTAAAAALFLFGGVEAVRAAAAPEVTSVIVGRDTGTDRVVLTLVGKSLTKFTGFTLADSNAEPVPGTIDTLLRSKAMLVLRLPVGVAAGQYDLTGALKTGDPLHLPVTVSDLSSPGTLNDAANLVDWTQLKGVPAALADGVDDDAWTTSGSDVFRSGGRVVAGAGSTSSPATLQVAGTEGVLFGGTSGSGSIPETGPGTRMMWYPGKAAFRAGSVFGAEWDDASVGQSSVALGQGTTASGVGSTAMGISTTASTSGSTAIGSYTTASGNSSTALGIGTNASGPNSTAVGNYTTATGTDSTAMGVATTASGDYSTAMGYITTASGWYSTALGQSTAASGYYSTAMGSSTIAGGVYSTAMGYYSTASGNTSAAVGFYTTASGDYSTAMGYRTTAQASTSVVLGQFNVVSGTPNSWVATDPVLVVGNGSFGSPSNGFTLLRNGDLTIAGALTQNSDERLKKDVAPLAGVLRKIAAIRGVSYRLKDETRGPAGAQIGLLAQEVREVFPELVHEDTQGTLSVAYGNFSAVLLEAVKEQQAAIAKQQATLDARDLEVAALKRELAEERAATGKRLSRLEALLAECPAPAKGK